MEIVIEQENKKYIFHISGRLDAISTPELEGRIKELFGEMEQIVFDLAGLEYVSSAGLRVLLASQKKMNGAGGSMKIINANDNVKDVFNITGLLNIFELE